MEVAVQRLAKVRQLIESLPSDDGCRYTPWQWEHSGKQEFWNTHFLELGKATRTLRGKDLQQHLQQRAPTEAKSRVPWWLLLSYALLWLCNLGLASYTNQAVFATVALYYSFVEGFWLFLSFLGLKRRTLGLSKGAISLLMIIGRVLPPLAASPALWAFDHEGYRDLLFMYLIVSPNILFLLIIGDCMSVFSKNNCIFGDRGQETKKYFFEEDELILVSGYFNAALPLNNRMSKFTPVIESADPKLISKIEADLMKSRKTQKGISLLFESFCPLFRDEHTLFESLVVKQYIIDLCSHKLRTTHSSWLKSSCPLCSESFRVQDRVCYLPSEQPHAYLLHVPCLITAKYEEVNRFLDPLHAISMLQIAKPDLPQVIPVYQPTLITPVKEVDWQALLAYAEAQVPL